MTPRNTLGASYEADFTCSFLVWAPKASTVEVHISSPVDLIQALAPLDSGYFYGRVQHPEAQAARYKYRLNGQNEYPDPASRYQPEGVHGRSQVVPAEFAWTDHQWTGLPLQEYVIYELHVGTFTAEGTFDAVIERLDYLKDLGVNAIELMPVAQFPGNRNWGYDGVYLFAVQDSYGGPLGLKRLVNAAHSKGLAVVLDVVYNHFGPEGNYLGQYGQYFTGRYSTPWGDAINFDGDNSAAVRRFIVENALQWTTEFHIDALRLDAIHAIFDASDRHILREIAESIRENISGRQVHVIAESNLNDIRTIQPVSEGGLGLDAQWNDDFHHALHTLLTREQTGYYEDFGSIQQVAKSYSEGFVYSGEFSKYRRRPHGTSSKDIPASQFIVFTQNHDQTGNRMMGERLSQLITLQELKIAAAAFILSPFVPMLFMGQEYAENAPFLYFVSHSDPSLIEAVRNGRRSEFAAFAWQGEAPDPQAEETFLQSKLHHDLLHESQHRAVFEFYKELLRLRRSLPALRRLSKTDCKVTCLEDPPVLTILRSHGPQQALLILYFGAEQALVELQMPPGVWRNEMESADTKWLGAGGSLSEEIRSDGMVALRLPGKSVSLLTQTANR